jgi:DNA polymerase-3 subunit epsilon
MIWRRFTADGRRRRLRAGVPEGPLRDYLDTPFPNGSTPLSSLNLLAVDIETTGMEPDRDTILSIGWVPVDGRSIILGGAQQYIIRSDVEVGQSAVVHGVTDDVVATGVDLEVAMAALLQALRGRAMLCHFARLERRFLSTVCRTLYGAPFACTAVDTLQIQARLNTSAWQQDPNSGTLRLWVARDRFGLPRYRAHEALTDALACAELYLAQIAELGPMVGTLKSLQRS